MIYTEGSDSFCDVTERAQIDTWEKVGNIRCVYETFITPTPLLRTCATGGALKIIAFSKELQYFPTSLTEALEPIRTVHKHTPRGSLEQSLYILGHVNTFITPSPPLMTFSTPSTFTINAFSKELQ